MREASWWIRLPIVALILLAGFGGMALLIALRQEPAQEAGAELIASAHAIHATPQTLAIPLKGLATARSPRRVELAPEVGGRIAEISPRLATGRSFAAGEMLYKIDDAPYKLAVAQARAEAERLEAMLAGVDIEEANTKRRLEVAQRTLELAGRELERSRKLSEDGGVVSRASVENSEMLKNQREEQVVSLENALKLIPNQRKLTRAQLDAARARLAEAELNLGKTSVTAPFDCFIDSENAEPGHLAQPGVPLAVAVDGSTMELATPLDAKEAARWLPVAPVASDENFYGDLPNDPIAVHWTEDPAVAWTGRLDRIAGYAPETRTVIVVVTVEADSGEIPLADGMFCEIEIPGRTLDGVFRIPAAAVASEDEVLLAVDGRLKTQKVKVLRRTGGDAYIGAGLAPDDIVLVTRPSIALDGALIEPVFDDAPGSVENAP